MKTTLTLALAALTALFTTSVLAGPGFVDRAPAAPARTTAVAHQPMAGCKTMTIATNPKGTATNVVRCDAFAKVRMAECRLACH